MKQHVAGVLQRRGWVVRFEATNADVVAFRPGLGRIWSLECERSAKWIVRNVLRDQSSGASGVVVVALTEGIVAAARRQVSVIPLEVRAGVMVVVVDQFDEGYVETMMEKDTRL
jgi:hypothetical protein